jgi:hypothetical protein
MDPPKIRTLKEMAKRFINKEKTGEATDEQTGKVFEVWSEALWDTLAAGLSVLYLTLVLFFLCWALIEIYYRQNYLIARIFTEKTRFPDSPLSRVIAYVVIGGAMGGIVNGFRSIVSWHAEKKAFGWRFIWKYITLPPLGALLAAMVYAIVYGGVGILGGTFAETENQALSAFAIGALSGYGSHKVFLWLDEQVNRLFVLVKVPDLTGKTQKEAELALDKVRLKLGKVNKEESTESNIIDKVIRQVPVAGSRCAKGTSVDITIAVKTV